MKRLTPEAVDVVAEAVRCRTGLVFQPSRRADFAGALAHAMGRAGVRDAVQYLERLQDQPALLDDLIAEITVGETYFFRDPRQLEVVRELAIERFPPERNLRLWSAGCASGEEPYTLAMILREAGRTNATVTGTDLSRSALTRARQARYTRWSLRGVPEERLRAFFQMDGNQARPTRTIREAVEFRYLNLAEDTYPSLAAGIWHMDVILCRNVLIYLDSATVARVAKRLLDSLSPDGWLFLGGADPMLGNLVSCEVVTTDSGLAYRRKESPKVRPLPRRIEPVVPPAATVTLAAAVPVEPVPEAPRVEEPAVAGPTQVIAEIRNLANSGSIEQAMRLSDQALERFRTSAELFYLQSVLLAEAGQYPAAAEAARRALYLDRDLAVAHLALGRSLAHSGDVHGSRVALQNAARLLGALPPDAIVPAADGELAGRLATMARMQLRLTEGAA